jgi:tetratricopeptide (TPR) repeat protein
LFRAGDFKPALAELRARIGLQPRLAFLHALSAEVKRSPRVALFSEALEDLERAVSLEPRSAWMLGYRSKALAQAGRLAEAAEALDAALRLEPSSPWLRAERAFLRRARGDSRAIEDAAAACRLDAGSYEARLSLAAALGAAGRAGEALAACDAALELRRRGADAALPGAGRPSPWSLRFELLRAQGRWSEAARSLAQAAHLGERLLWEPNGNASRGALEEALRQVEQALLKSRDKRWPHFWRGDILLRLGREEEGEAALEAAVARGGGVWAVAWRGWARARLGRVGPALADLRRAARSLGPGPQAARLHVIAARCLREAGRAKQIERLLRGAAEQWPQADTFVRLAEARLSLGRGAEADAALRQALETDAGMGPAYVLRAKIRSRRGDLEGALSDLARAKRVRGSLAPLLAPLWPAPASRDIEPAGAPSPRLGRVLVDPRIELAGLLQTALERPREPEPDFCRRLAPELAAYVEEGRRRFVPRLEPSLLERFAKTARSRGNAAFPWLGVTQMMMGLSPAPELAVESPAWRDAEDLALLAGLRRFVENSGFLDFCRSWSKEAVRWTRPMAATVEKEPYAETVSDYLGVRVDAYYDVVLAPLLRGVSLRAILLSDDGRRGARTVFCPLSSPELLQASVLKPKPEDLLWTGWHELLHMRIDSWTEFYAPETEPFRGLYERLPRHARRKDWLDCVSEHQVRAATQRMLGLRLGTAAQADLAAMDRREGYLFQDALAEGLALYESERGRYPTLFDFFPEWLKVWRAQR